MSLLIGFLAWSASLPPSIRAADDRRGYVTEFFKK